ncbi:MAG: hypothetical protein K0Q49_1566 [Haloplasmataceae bacterium]|jgi:hypothetical protein|nr:hypothetical protein [Haloplasmataceae bacterium]
MFSDLYKADEAMNGSRFGQLTITSVKNNLMTKPFETGSHFSRAGFVFSYALSAYNVYKTVRSVSDDDYSYDQATKLGWIPK